MKYYFLALGTLVVVCVGCISDGQSIRQTNKYTAPPAQMMQRPGPMVDGPGPAVMAPLATGPVTQAQYCPPGAPGYIPGGVPGIGVGAPMISQIRFLNPTGSSLGWQIGQGYANNQLMVPERKNLTQGYTYRLKWTNFANREGLVLYPTLQVFPAHPTTAGYLEHNTVPIELTDEDLDQIESNNFVTKVIYLPEPKYQDFAIGGVGNDAATLVSTRLQPGVDPVAEADRRGTIMAVLRVGNMNMEMPGRREGEPNAMIGPNGKIVPAAHQADGNNNEFIDPVPIAVLPTNGLSVPSPAIMATRGLPGQPAYHPMPGMGPVPPHVWGQPITATPIGLPGPTHLPYGGRATLKSHTMRNLTRQQIPDGIDHMVMDVQHKPGIRVPKPVGYIRYTEKHPNYAPQDLSIPAWARGGQGTIGPNGEYCPPGQTPQQP